MRLLITDTDPNDPILSDLEIPRKFAENLPLKDLGFTNITKIFQARRYSELQEQFYGSLWVYLSEC